MIKTIFFDFDGVLTLQGGGCDATIEFLARTHRLPKERLDPLFRAYNDTLLTEPKRYDSFLDELNAEMNSSITTTDIHQGVLAAKHNLEMLTLAKALREKGYLTGIITDNNTERMELLHESFSLGEFSPLIVSAATGSTKGQGPAVFEYALEAAGILPYQALFIDNDRSNIRIAEKAGLLSHWHDHTKNDISRLYDRLAELAIDFSR